MLEVAPHVRDLGSSGIREIVNLAEASSRDIARLEIGEPGFRAASHILDAGRVAATRSTGYTHSAGVLELREAIAAGLLRRYDWSVAPEDVIVAQGAGQGISAVLSALVQPGDQVLIPDPAWPNYRMLTRLFGAVPVPYRLRAEDGFLPDIDRIAALITPRTRAIVLNSPSNPTGAVFPRELVRRIVELAAARDVLVISDEVYDELIFDGEPAHAAGFGTDNVVSVFSFSKTYAMTGWRVGYVVAPRWLAPTLAHIQEPLLSCISAVSQAAALAAVSGPQDDVASMRSAYRVRREIATAMLEPVVPFRRPDGAFYAMVALAPGVDSRLAALDLVEAGVSVAPGSAFGDEASDQIRISLASPDDVLVTGIERLVAWMASTDRGLAMGALHQDSASHRRSITANRG
ncbi:pyridoxal phosphate-dependent aminotransferase [Microbacterium sp. 18062]|uniref:pyridoxal phosphate-dependent aminotransferase n=1 Tax=Microbacterium sp. 18062 TaxID=2681410 RepID=UPI00135C91AE|nr:aminotransferase class I/II-fold pyridoxal phosphate-dependent enzyme [Microbacterium sp. 18062]